MSEKKGNPIVLVSGIVGVLIIGAGWRMMSAADLEKRAKAIGWDAEIGLISQGDFAQNIENSEKLHPRVKQLEKNAAEVGWVYSFGAPPYDENRLAELEKEVQESTDLYPRVVKLQERAKKITLDLPIVDKEKKPVRDGSAIQGFPYTDASLKKTAEYVGEMEKLHERVMAVQKATKFDLLKDSALPDLRERLEKFEKLQKEGKDFSSYMAFNISDLDHWLALEDMLSPVKIPAGSFDMGCNYNEKTCNQVRYGPKHKVKITRSFYMMKTEVTQKLYEAVTGKNPTEYYGFAGYKKENFHNPDFPVTHVGWDDAIEFSIQLNKQLGLPSCYEVKNSSNRRYTVEWRLKQDCKGWRLPTEAEWVYAAQGGKNQSGSDDCEEVAHANCKKTKRPKDKIGLAAVCSKKENGYGLCDMYGNSWEWCWDRYYDRYFSESPSVDPIGPDPRKWRGRVAKGGNWESYPAVLRHVYRDSGSENTGLRLVRTAE